MKYVLRVLGALAAALALSAAALLVFTLTPLSATPPGQAIRDMLGVGQSAAVNVALDASGIKAEAEEALRDNAGTIALETGMSEDAVNEAIDGLGIEDWQVVNLPKDAQATDARNVTYGGVSAKVIAYSDPSYISIEMQGQTFTLAVPDSAQDYIPLLEYL